MRKASTRGDPPVTADPHDTDQFQNPASTTAQGMLELILADYRGAVAIRLWNGETVTGNSSSPCTVVFRHPAPLRDLVLHKDLARLAEAYLIGDLDIEGDIESLFDLVEYLQQHMPQWPARLRMIRHALHLPYDEAIVSSYPVRATPDEQRNSLASIAYHYDIGNEFYSLWLDPGMVYSCAYFKDSGQSLVDAQRDKLDYICRKLRLAAGQTLLDIGCGWGALVMWAARHYGVHAHGITLSEQQYRYATERVRREGLEKQVRIDLRDYRNLSQDGQYDRVVSVGMFEHVGVANFPAYFEIIKKNLKPGGLFVNHSITNDTGWQSNPLTRFINRYVFPDGELARISDMVNAMERAGFEVIDVEGLRRHYNLTLRHWIRALEAHQSPAVNIVGEATYRVWRLYMAGAAYYFNEGSMGVYQVLSGHSRQPLTTPLRRDDLYPSLNNEYKPALAPHAG